MKKHKDSICYAICMILGAFNFLIDSVGCSIIMGGEAKPGPLGWGAFIFTIVIMIAELRNDSD